MSLTFDDLRSADDARQGQVYDVSTWSATDWGCALAGETGELCNLLKKRKRRQETSIRSVKNFSKKVAAGQAEKVAISKELADVVIYCDLLAHHLTIDLGEAVRDKFNEVSERVESTVRL